MKEPLFTWDNWKYFFKELLKMLSHQKSFFSFKRFMTMVAFAIGEYGLTDWYFVHRSNLNYTEAIAWALVNLAYCGFAVGTLQKEKRHNDKMELNKPENEQRDGNEA